MHKKKSKRWTRQETVTLLHLYNARKAEFSLPRKRRLAFAHVREEMISAGFDANITVHHLEVKMQTLLRAYKAAKDKANANGISTCHAPFFEEMGNVFGDSYNDSKRGSINFESAFDLVVFDESILPSASTVSTKSTTSARPTASNECTSSARPRASPKFTTPKRRWTKKETMTFLHFYNARKKEFTLSRKRRLAYSRVRKDMLSVGFDANIKVNHLEIKMQTMLRPYKAWKSNPNPIGDPLAYVPFFEQLENIFSDNSSDSKCEAYFNPDYLNDNTKSDVFMAPHFGLDASDVTASTTSIASIDLEDPTTTVDKMSRSEYRRRRLEQKDRKQKAAAERWSEYIKLKKEWEEKKLDIMQKLLKQ